jgi:hypothetical protein
MIMTWVKIELTEKPIHHCDACGGVNVTEDRRYQIASGWVLTDEIPKDYFEWTDLQQDGFLLDNVSEDYQDYDASGLWEQIESLEGLIRYALKEVE